MNDLVTVAVRNVGGVYLNAEQQLRRDRANARPALTQAASAPEPARRLLGQVLLSWHGETGKLYDQAIAYLDRLPKRLERTPMPSPSPLGAMSYLDKHYQDRVVPVLSLRLLKEPDWPDWRAFAVLLYLGKHGTSDTLPVLVRYAAATPNPERREDAIKALQSIGGPQLKPSLEAERRARLAAGMSWPVELENLYTAAP